MKRKVSPMISAKDSLIRYLTRFSQPADTVIREIEFVRSMNIVFYRIALTGVAAIVLLADLHFSDEGSLSFNSFLGTRRYL
ncbi:MAG: hypothetical protein MZV63_16400 [Marinilabiliales bacterium]|nr:hypothetical protein [Marinilabiliales bacterium]